MRISEWSSEVSSSDLPWKDFRAKLRVNMQQEALMQERVAPITASRNTEMLRGLIMTACCGLLMTVILPSLRIIEQAWKSAATANLLPLSTMALVLSLILLTHARQRQDARR